MSLLNSCVPGSKVLVLGMVIPPLIGNPHNGNINPYYWVHDHLLLYGNNGSLDPDTCDLKTSKEYPTIPLLLLSILEFSLGTLAGPMVNINNNHHVPIPPSPSLQKTTQGAKNSIRNVFEVTIQAFLNLQAPCLENWVPRWRALGGREGGSTNPLGAKERSVKRCIANHWWEKIWLVVEPPIWIILCQNGNLPQMGMNI